jgi:type III secretion protein K
MALPSTLLATAAPAADANAAARRDPLVRLRVGLRFHTDLVDGLHASWLPPEWPQPLRLLSRYGAGAREPLQRCLRQRWQVAPPPFVAADGAPVDPLAALGWIDAASLRRLAVLIGWSTHRALWRERSLVGRLNRCAARHGAGTGRYVTERLPVLPQLAMDLAPLLARPHSIGRTVTARGYRLLRSLLAEPGDAMLCRSQLKLPRRVAAARVPALDAPQRRELHELVRLCLIPDRLPTWDWLF